jgi:class 3 adenylate cyclase
MYQLEDIAFRYLPRTLIEHWSEYHDIRPVWGKWLEGSLMHCDVTGFTAMSEKLAEVGKEGGELMAGVLNQFFERMLAIAISWGGIQMKFGGDAMLLYFPGSDHAQRAAACGLEMQSAMREFSRVKVKNDYHKLLMRIGIHSGSFYTCSVGQVGTKIGQGEGLLHYYIVGKDVNIAADTEPMAEPGQVVISYSTYSLLDREGNKIEKTAHDGIFLVKRITAKKHRLKYFDDSTLPHHILQRYLMKPIAEGISSGKSEHRRVTIIFIYLTGVAKLIEDCGDDAALLQLDAYTNLVVDTAEKYGGHFAASDASEHGDKLIVLFGAPVVQDSQEACAMHFALELKNEIQKLHLNLEHHIGINTGYVFSGEIGSSSRREYTVIGDSVNLSARLMASAKQNEIIVSDFTASKVYDEFKLVKLEPIMVKGKKDPVSICRLEGVSEIGGNNEVPENTSFFGRKEELKAMNNYFMTVVNEGSNASLLLGEPGSGKTELADEFLRSNQSDNRQAISVCHSYDENSAYSCISKILMGILGCNQSDNERDIVEELNNNIDRYIPDFIFFTPLVAEILGLHVTDNPVTASLDPKTRREKRYAVITELIAHISTENPVILFIDNIQWIDRSSSEILSSMIEQDDSHIFILSTARRNDELDKVAENIKKNVITVNNLTREDSFNLLVNLSGINDNGFLESVYEKTQGNPLFLVEMAQSGYIETGSLPDSIYDVVVSKMDKLSPDYKYFLQSVSVVGQSFGIDEIVGVY